MKTPAVTKDRWGIWSHYKDASGNWHQISRRTRSAIRAAMGLEEPEHSRVPKSGLNIIQAGQRVRLKEPADLVLEDGTTLSADHELPRDLPFGYHALKDRHSGTETRLVVTPGKCYLPESLRAWGWALQLYALRSKQSWGIGDFGDLKNFSGWAARELNCDFILANPFGAATPILPQEASPYYPGSRRFLNPLYLCIEDIAGAGEAGIGLDRIAAAGRALNRNRLIDRDAVFRLKMKALECIWRRLGTNSTFEAFCKNREPDLNEFATFCSLAEHFQTGWTRWPQSFRRPDSSAVRTFARSHRRRIRFHQWVQWLLDQQLTRAVKQLPIMHDLPIGVDPAGADAWIWQDLLAKGTAVGAPPDTYNTRGQNWGVPPFIPHRLRESGYEPLRQTLRATLRLGGALRIDHVAGLFRLFWIPENSAPGDGAFVDYPAAELLSIVALESHRARAVVVGEDLGTMESGMRTELRRRKILSYRLLWFESRSIKRFPRQALSAVTTHDLSTVAGLWDGSDIRAQKRLGLRPNQTGTRNILNRLKSRLRLREDAKVSTVIARTYRLLSRAPSMLLAAILDDALMVAERPNMPGTASGWPNWSLALPVPLEALRKASLIKKISRACRRRNPNQSPGWKFPTDV